MTISLPSREVIKAIYKQQITRFGGINHDGDDVKIRAALAWPRMMVTTKNGADIFVVAASLMMGFINGRAAIVNNDLATKNSEIDNVSEQLEIVAAATAVHYINDVLGALNEGKVGEAFHVLSEAWTFVNAIKYNGNRRLTLDAIEEINETDFGADGNFWNVTVEGLNKAKNTLISTYPELESSKDEL